MILQVVRFFLTILYECAPKKFFKKNMTDPWDWYDYASMKGWLLLWSDYASLMDRSCEPVSYYGRFVFDDTVDGWNPAPPGMYETL